MLLKFCISTAMAVLLSGCGHLFYFPDKRQFATPERFGYIHESHFFHTADNIKLHAWLLKSKLEGAPKGTVVFFHGNAENLSTHFMSLAWMTDHGFDVLIFDYRGYGQSEGVPDKDGLLQDGRAAIELADHFHQTRQCKGPLIVYGQSLGGMVAIPSLATSPLKEKVALLVVDASFDTYQGMAFNRLKSRWFIVPFSPLAFVLLTDRLAAKHYYKNLPAIPALVIHGEADDVVPIEFGEKIYAGLSGKKQFLKIPGGKHGDAFFVNEKKHRTEFLTLMDSLIANPKK